VIGRWAIRLISGVGSLDTDLMRARPTWVAKRGAEKLLCAASAAGTGIA
jgi:L-asparaginase II